MIVEKSKAGRKPAAPGEKKVNIQCYIKPENFEKIGRRRAAILAEHLITEVNKMMEDGESFANFKVVRK